MKLQESIGKSKSVKLNWSNLIKKLNLSWSKCKLRAWANNKSDQTASKSNLGNSTLKFKISMIGTKLLTVLNLTLRPTLAKRSWNKAISAKMVRRMERVHIWTNAFKSYKLVIKIPHMVLSTVELTPQRALNPKCHIKPHKKPHLIMKPTDQSVEFQILGLVQMTEFWN